MILLPVQVFVPLSVNEFAHDPDVLDTSRSDIAPTQTLFPTAVVNAVPVDVVVLVPADVD